MVVLNKGDWVLVGVNGCEGIGKITLLNFHPKTHLVKLADNSMPMAVLRNSDLLKKLDEGLYPILSDSINNEEN